MNLKALSCFLLTISSFILKAQETKEALSYFQLADKAYQERNIENYYSYIIKAYHLRPDHPEIIRNMARAYALKDSVDKSFKLLHRLWEMGLNENILQDSSFNSLKKDKRYASISKRLGLNSLPLNRSDTTIVIKEKGLITEGIAYDAIYHRFLISSVRKGKVLVFQNQEFVKYLPGVENLGAILGLKVDSKRKILWLCASYLPQYENYQDSLKGRTSVIKYDLQNEKIIRKYSLPIDDNMHSFGDLTIGSKGELFVTDSFEGALYKISEAEGIKQIANFSTGQNPSSLQGITLTEDGKYLFVADYLNGIYRIDLKTLKRIRMPHPLNITTVGVDGLYYYRGKLITIQNGIKPHRVIRLNLNKALTAIESQNFLEANHPAFGEPTLGVIFNDFFYYIAYSGWGDWDKEGKLRGQNNKHHVVLRLFLKDRRP